MFYKNNNGRLVQGENILNKSYSLIAANKDIYIFPVDGWYWFEDDSTAKTHFGIIVLPEWIGKCVLRIVAPKSLISTYPDLLYDLTVIRKLDLQDAGDYVLIYCDWIEPNHQALIDGSGGSIYVEKK